jgi:hypothetical protein
MSYSKIKDINNPNFYINKHQQKRIHANPFAESGGFEPPVRNYPYDSLANCWFKPLTQLSKALQI